jgi:hypothetical protein
MPIQPKAYDIIGEWSPELAARVDESFQILFNNLLSGTFDVAPGQLTGLIPVPQGGTGLASYAIGDLLYASAATTLAGLPIGAAGKLVRSTGTLPAYSTFTIPDTFTTGDLVYASGTNTLGKLADVATGNAVISGGVGTAPAWGKIALTTHVSGVLPIANGGTNSSTALAGSSIMISDGSKIVQGAAGTTTTLLHGNVAGAPSYGQVALAIEVSGVLPVANGGTNSSAALSGSSIVISDGSKLIQGPAGSTTTVLHGNAGGAPTYAAVALTTDVAGILPVGNGGSGTSTTFTTGSVVFAGASGVYSQNNAKLFWDNTNFKLGIGTASPNAALDVSNDVLVGGQLNNGGTGALLSVATGIYTPGFIWATGGIKLTTDARFELGDFPTSSRIRGAGGLQFASGGPYIVNFTSTGIYIYQGDHSTYGSLNAGGLAIGASYAGTTIPANGAIIEGKIGAGVSSPTAILHLQAGTASANTAPLKLNSGTVLTTPEAGAVEFTTDDFFATITTGAARKSFVLDNGARLTSGKVPVATTNGRLIDSTTALLLAASIPSVVGSTFEKAETGSDANVLTYTASGADEALVVQVAIDISALTGTSVVVTVAWQDSNNATQTSVLTLTGVSDGTINIPINAKASANVVVSTVFVGVSTAYNISAFIIRLK